MQGKTIMNFRFSRFWHRGKNCLESAQRAEQEGSSLLVAPGFMADYLETPESENSIGKRSGYIVRLFWKAL